MKRLIPAVIILVFIISVCICAHMYVDYACNQTISDIEKYYNKTISSSKLEHQWKIRKEKMALFVNHGFLDKISIYIGQLSLATNNSNNPDDFNLIYKNIESILSLIKAEQKFALHSFY